MSGTTLRSGGTDDRADDFSYHSRTVGSGGFVAVLIGLAVFLGPGAFLSDCVFFDSGIASARGGELGPTDSPKIPAWLETNPRIDAVLPPPPLPKDRVSSQADRGRRVLVREIDIHGNTVISDARLQAIASEFLGRQLGASDLEALRIAMTHEYVSQGFVSSGASLDLSELEIGIVSVEIKEGRVTQIVVETDGSFRKSILHEPLRRATRGVLNIFELEESLRLLQSDPQIDRLSARLEPGEELGQSSLTVVFEEATPLHATFAGANDVSPTIGAWRGVLSLSVDRLLGFGEHFSIEASLGPAVWQVNPSLIIPIIPFHSHLEFYGRFSKSEIVEEPFDVLDIETEVTTLGGRYSHNLFASPSFEISASLAAEWRRSKSLLDGFGFDFSGSTDNGVAKLFVLRPAFEGFWRAETAALGFRSTLSFGVDIPSTTNEEGAIADSRFVSWLGQLQGIQKIPLLDSRLLIRIDVQLANDSLLGLERFSLGGEASVRGYRENAIVRDNGVFGSVELRVPIPSPFHWLDAQVALFADAGHGWDDRDRTRRPSTLLGIGGGFVFELWERAQMEIFWGSDLKELPTRAERSLEDRGFHLRFSWSPPIQGW